MIRPFRPNNSGEGQQLDKELDLSSAFLQGKDIMIMNEVRFVFAEFIAL